MASGFKIGEGYLEIDADVDDALADVRKFFAEVDGELEAQEKAFAKSGAKSGKAFTEEIERSAKIDETFKQLTNHVHDVVDRESRRRGGLLGSLLGRGGGEGRGIGNMLRGLLTSARGGLGRGIGSLGRGLFSVFSKGTEIFSGISRGIANAFSTGLEQAQQIWKTASKVFDQIGDVGGGVAGIAKFAAYGTLIPMAIGLAGALSHLSAALLALPAGIGVAVAALAPLIVAFHGFGEAVSAGFSGDIDKFNEALKNLAPNARKVAKEIVGLKPLLTQLRTSVQEAFFGPLVGQLTKLGNAVLPTLWVGMSHVAGALGRIAAGFTNFLASKEAIGIINNLFMTTERILDTMGPSLINLFAAFFRLLNAGLPWVERFSALLSSGLQNVADWINKAIEPGGKFTGWMERAWNVGKQLWDVIKELGSVVGTMLNAFGDEGTDTLSGIANKLKEINEYLKSKEGQETLHNLGVIIHWAGDAFVWFLGTLTTAWRGLNAFFNFVRGIGPFFSRLWDDIVSGVMAVKNWFNKLGHSVYDALGTAWNAVKGFGRAVWDALKTAYNAVVGAGKAVIDWFVALPGMILDFVTSLPGMIGGAMSSVADTILYGIGYLGGLLVTFWTQTFPGWIRDAWNFVKDYTTEGISKTWEAIKAFPGQLWDTMVEIGNTIKNAVLDAWNWAYNYTVDGISRTWENIKSVPGKVSGTLSALGDAIGGWFSRAWTTAKNATVDGFNGVMKWIEDLPGKIGKALSGAGHWLYDVGRDMINGLVDGLESLLSWAVNAAKHAAERIKDGFMDALGVASPSKVMDQEVGRWILPGVVQGMEHTMPQMERYLGSTADMIRGGFNPVVNVAAPNVSVGGTTLLADLGEGIRQAVPVAIVRNPRVVAKAANVGNRQSAAWVNTGRSVITGATG